MSPVHHSFRFKLALTFALFGAMISLLLSLGLSFVAHNLGERLMDETLRAEIDSYISRRERNPNALLPSSVSIQGYLQIPGRDSSSIPLALRALGEGVHQLTLNGASYRVAVTEKGGERYFMLFNEQRQRQREKTFLIYLVAAAFFMILISASAGWWLAGRVVAPVAELARRVSRADPEDDAEDVACGFANDEIGQLAGVFAAYLKRMRAFIDRERDFTADVSHELRTPLSIVQGAVELLEDEALMHDKQQHRIAMIGRANREMVNLTGALLLMARETVDEAVVQTCDVCEVVSAAIEMNRHLLNEKTTVRLVGLAQTQIAAERMLLSIVVSNLIRNAFTHTPSGSVSIQVDELGVTISDTGIGISEDEVDKVFLRHFKGQSSTGSGIGLSLVKRICDRYGWKTVIDSTEGRGTTVQLTFPVRKV